MVALSAGSRHEPRVGLGSVLLGRGAGGCADRAGGGFSVQGGFGADRRLGIDGRGQFDAASRDGVDEDV